MLDKIKRHPLAVAATIAFLAASTVYGITEYFYQSRADLLSEEHKLKILKLQRTHDEQISDLKKQLDQTDARISSVERQFGDHQVFTADSFIVRRNNIRSLDGSRFVPIQDIDCYVLNHEETDWTFSKSNHLEMVGRLGVKIDSMPEQLQREGKALPLFMWETKESYLIKFKYYNAEVFPYVVIRPMPHELLLGKFEQFVEPPESSDEDGSTVDIALLEQNYRGDSVGVYLTQFLSGMIQQNLRIQNTRSTITNIQKAHNILYVNIVTRLRDVRVNGSDPGTFYFSSELWVFSTRERLYVVETFHPSADERFNDGHSSRINAWLGHFRIVLD